MMNKYDTAKKLLRDNDYYGLQIHLSHSEMSDFNPNTILKDKEVTQGEKALFLCVALPIKVIKNEDDIKNIVYSLKLLAKNVLTILELINER